MLIGVRNDCVVADGLEQSMSIAKSLGYDFTELVLKPEDVDKMGKAKIDSYINTVNKVDFPIKTASLGNFTFYSEMSSEEKATINRQIINAIDLAKALRARVLLLATMEGSKNISDFVDIYRENLEEVADYALDNKVSLAFEPVGRYPSSLIDALVRAIDHEGIGMYYDMGNCIYGGEDPVDQIKLSVDIVKAIHIKGGADNILENMPLEEIFNVLKATNFSGPSCIEIGSEDNTNEHLISAMSILKKYI